MPLPHLTSAHLHPHFTCPHLTSLHLHLTLCQDNFFLPLCEKHRLFGEEGFMRDEEMSALDHVGMDESGARACSMYEVSTA